MSPKDKLEELRRQISKIDQQLIELFLQRMQVSEDIAETKTTGNIAFSHEKREREMIDSVLSTLSIPESDRAEVIAYMRSLIAFSKLRQKARLIGQHDLYFPESGSWNESRVLESATPSIGFQGVSGAWGEHGAMQLFPNIKERKAFEYFEDVFDAVKSKKIDFGVVPIENSQTGAIGEVYDLLRRHSCFIVGEVWVSVAHCLLANPGTPIGDVREVFSHPEGFRQCHRFLKNKHWDLTASRNTAVAAQLVHEKGDRRYAAIGSRRAAQLYGLDILASDMMDNPHNKTRFIAIAESPIYDASSNIVSVTFSTAHECGALCSILQVFMLAGLNLCRIESRPVLADRYRFFADLHANILDETAVDAFKRASVLCEYFEILGCYSPTQENTALYRA
ncbi:MAG: bifunctional chorismate mutase/prephenate dehydratase [Thermoguttaceae bacterium]